MIDMNRMICDMNIWNITQTHPKHVLHSFKRSRVDNNHWIGLRENLQETPTKMEIKSMVSWFL